MRTSQLAKAGTAKRSTPKPARECWRSSKASDQPRDFTTTSNTMMTKRNSGSKELSTKRSSLSEVKRRYRRQLIAQVRYNWPTTRELRTRNRYTRRMAYWSDSFLLLWPTKVKMMSYHSRGTKTTLANRQLPGILNPSDHLTSLLQLVAYLWVLKGLVTLITDLRQPVTPTILKTSSIRASSGKISRLANHCLQTSVATGKGNNQLRPTWRSPNLRADQTMAPNTFTMTVTQKPLPPTRRSSPLWFGAKSDFIDWKTQIVLILRKICNLKLK